MRTLNRREQSGAVALGTAAMCLDVFPMTQRQRQTHDTRNHAPDEHPDSFVRRRAGKEPGHVGGEGVRGVDAHDCKHDPAHKQGQRDSFVHNDLSVSFDVSPG